MKPTPSADLRARLGSIDVYLFDQFLRGRFDDRRSVLDVGCGGGRNLVYALQAGLDVFAADRDRENIASVRRLAAELAPELPADHFQVADARQLPFADGRFDAVVCNALLHFASDEAEFRAWLAECRRVLAPGGLFFARLTSDIGIEDRVQALGHRRFQLPDGSQRFLVNEAMLLEETERMGGRLLDPIKTTNVQNLRCMTTWVVEVV